MQRDSVYEWIRGKTWMRDLENQVLPRLSKTTFGPSPPNVFVGEYGYPSVRAGPLVGLDEGVLDAPTDLYGLNYPELLRHRALLARGFTVQHVHRTEEEAFWLAAAQKPLDVEMQFEKTPRFSLSFSEHVQPMGPSGVLERMRLTENPKVPKKVDALIQEKLKVKDALSELLPRFDYHYVQKLLSAGILGQKRKLVPTKWSITATDDMIAKEWLEQIRGFPETGEYRIYSNNYLYNHFEILLLPGAWEFEQFESFENQSNIAHEYEAFEGRTRYAEGEGGGYYAGRFGVAEALFKMKRQARAIVFREVSPKYVVPVGVWEVRENVRHAFTRPPFKTSNFNDAVTELKKRLKQPWSQYLKKSRILTQRKLSQY
ncbi:hypothetical protein HY572_00470 [Candidatus Micrarchaeota archaeon]|nr:hypothetical protein [Candidatus Micrarchaeota archaeon]